MIPAAFDYKVAESAEQAIALLGEYGDESKLLAGGHSLIPMMKFRLAAPTVLIDVGRITDLSYIREADGHLAIGAMTKHVELETSDVVAQHAPHAWPCCLARRRPVGPPSRHARRHARPQRPRLRSAGSSAGARWHHRGPGPWWHAERSRPTSSSPATSSRYLLPTR